MASLTVDDLDLFPPAADPRPGAAPARRCLHPRGQRFRLGDDGDQSCGRCGKLIDLAASRRGRTNRTRGNAIEREIARKLGLRRVGQFGGPEDAAGDWLIVQVKSGGAFPERVWRWLQALPSNAGQTRAVVVTDAPGPGHRRRAVVILDLDDWAALHGIAEGVNA